MPHDPRYCSCPYCGIRQYGSGTSATFFPTFASNAYAPALPSLSLDESDSKPFVKVGGRPPAPIAAELAAQTIDEMLARWLPPNANVGPRRRRRRRAPRQVRPVRARPGMRH